MSYRELARELRELADWAWREADRAVLLRAAASYDGLASDRKAPRPKESSLEN